MEQDPEYGAYACVGREKKAERLKMRIYWGSICSCEQSADRSLQNSRPLGRMCKVSLRDGSHVFYRLCGCF